MQNRSRDLKPFHKDFKPNSLGCAILRLSYHFLLADSSVVPGAIPGDYSFLVFLKTSMSLQPLSQQTEKDEDQSLGPEKSLSGLQKDLRC